MTEKRGPDGFGTSPERYGTWTAVAGLGNANVRRLRLLLFYLPGFRPHAPKRNVIVVLAYVYGVALLLALAP